MENKFKIHSVVKEVAITESNDGKITEHISRIIINQHCEGNDPQVLYDIKFISLYKTSHIYEVTVTDPYDNTTAVFRKVFTFAYRKRNIQKWIDRIKARFVNGEIQTGRYYHKYCSGYKRIPLKYKHIKNILTIERNDRQRTLHSEHIAVRFVDPKEIFPFINLGKYIILSTFMYIDDISDRLIYECVSNHSPTIKWLECIAMD